MKKRAQSAKGKPQTEEEVYSCTNQEVLNALFIGVQSQGGSNNNGGHHQHASPNRQGGVMSVEALYGGNANELSDDSSAEDDLDIVRQHSRLMKHAEFQQIQRDGFLAQADQSINNQLDSSSRQNILESGSLQMQQSTSSPTKSAYEASPQGRTQTASNLQASDTFGRGSASVQQQHMYPPGLMGALHQQQQFALQMGSPQTNNNMPDLLTMGSGGNLSYRQKSTGSRSTSKGKRCRPISAYPVPGSYGGFLSQISESVESTTQASHLSRFTHGLAHNNASRKQYVPHNIDTFEKEKLYTESISLKKQRNDVMQQNTLLKTNLKGAETDLRKKDQIIAQLTNEIKLQANQSQIGHFVGAINQNSFLQTPPELQALQGGFNSGNNRQARQIYGQKTNQLLKQNTDYRKRIKDLKCDVALKETEVQNLQRTLKFTKLKEFEIELQTYSQEILRLKSMLMQERTKPRVDPAQYVALQNQLIAERQQMQQLAQNSESQRQDIEKLTQAHAHSKQKLQRSKTKLKKLISTKKRHETKIKVLEQKVVEQKEEAFNSSNFRNRKGSKTRKVGGNRADNKLRDNECYDQLQTQLEINQILIDKLDTMGVDVRELIRTSQAVSGENAESDVKMVIFTFVGPEGLIEGGDNQQFEMPIDFNQVSQVAQIQDILRKELVMDQGIDLVLREKQSGQVLEQLEDVHIAIQSGDGILVQFVEQHQQLANGAAANNNMANINEEDEKSEYSDEQFEDEDDKEDQDEKPATIPRLTKANVARGLKQIRLLFMIKKVPRSHMTKYLLRDADLLAVPDNPADHTISTKSLTQIFERKFNFGSGKATKMARFFVEGIAPTDDPSGNQIEQKDWTTDRETLIGRVREHVADYMIYNSLAIDSMLSRLQGIVDGKQTDFLDDLNLDDEDSNGFLSFEQIQKVWKYGGLPQLDEELTEFMEFLALRVSPSLKKVNYEDFCKVFEEGYTLPYDCQHDDDTVFDEQKQENDDHDLEQIQRHRNGGNSARRSAKSDKNDNAEENPENNEEEPEIDSDDLMLYIDEALQKIVQKLPGDKKKTSLNKNLLPLARATLDQEKNETLLLLQPQVFIQFMVQQLGVAFSDKELYCLLHILVREQDSDQSAMADPAASQSLNGTNQESAGYILYRDVYTLLRNYLRKQKIMQQSVDLGLDYQVLTKPTFDFLLRFKQVLNTSAAEAAAKNEDETGEKAENHQASESETFRTAFTKWTEKKRFSSEQAIDLIEFDNFFDGLFMRFKIRCPDKDTMDNLKLLLCVQFGPNIKEQSYFLMQKIERVLYDLDYVYVNLVKILRESNHEKLQKEAAKRLKQRYDFVARGISKTVQQKAQAIKKVSVQEGAIKEESTTQARAGAARGAKTKARPMSSKPRKAAAQSVAKQPSEEEMDFEDNVDEDVDADDGIDEDPQLGYDRQKTKDIGFELPGDDDEDEEDPVDDDYSDDIQDEEDEEAQPMATRKGGKAGKGDDSDEDQIDDEYSDDDDVDSNPPIKETKTLKQIQDEAEVNVKKSGAAAYAMPNDDGDDESYDDGAFVEEEILDDYD